MGESTDDDAPDAIRGLGEHVKSARWTVPPGLPIVAVHVRSLPAASRSVTVTSMDFFEFHPLVFENVADDSLRVKFANSVGFPPDPSTAFSVTFANPLPPPSLDE